MSTVFDKNAAILVAKQLLKIHAVTINTVKPYRYVSGMLAPIYTDNRLLISHTQAWSVIIDQYIAAIGKRFQLAEVFSGTATAAIPHAAVVAFKLEKPMVYVRTSKKEHGKENQIEGEFEKGSNVLIIEDLVSTGKSIAENVNAIRTAGGVVTDCLAITTSTLSAFENTMSELKIQLTTLTDIQTVIQTALMEKYISADDEKIVQQFLQNPKAWGHQMGFE